MSVLIMISEILCGIIAVGPIAGLIVWHVYECVQSEDRIKKLEEEQAVRRRECHVSSNRGSRVSSPTKSNSCVNQDVAAACSNTVTTILM